MGRIAGATSPARVIRPLPVKVSDNARAQIEEAAAWWAKNRPAAPGAIREELDRILGLLAVQPGMGAPARDETLEVIAFWHTSRGRTPPL